MPPVLCTRSDGGPGVPVSAHRLATRSATAGVVSDWMYEGVAEHYAAGASLQFLRRHNPWALNAIVERLLEADQRKLWTPKAETRAALQATLIASETTVEERAEVPT